MKTDFSALLDKEVGSAPKPKPVPRGTYDGTIAALPKIVERNTKAGVKGILQIPIALNSAGPDVDETELEESGGLTLDSGVAKRVTKEFWLDDDSMWQVDQFLEGFGFVVGGGVSYSEALEQLVNRSVTASVDQREYNGRFLNDVKQVHANE